MHLVRPAKWLPKGDSSSRCVREFFLTFLLTITAWTLIFLLCRQLHWKALLHRPFTSAEFWIICLSAALGSALSNHIHRTKSSHHARCNRIDSLCSRRTLST